MNFLRKLSNIFNRNRNRENASDTPSEDVEEEEDNIELLSTSITRSIYETLDEETGELSVHLPEEDPDSFENTISPMTRYSSQTSEYFDSTSNTIINDNESTSLTITNYYNETDSSDIDNSVWVYQSSNSLPNIPADDAQAPLRKSILKTKSEGANDAENSDSEDQSKDGSQDKRGPSVRFIEEKPEEGEVKRATSSLDINSDMKNEESGGNEEGASSEEATDNVAKEQVEDTGVSEAKPEAADAINKEDQLVEARNKSEEGEGTNSKGPDADPVDTSSTAVVQEDAPTDGTTDIKSEPEGDGKGEAGPSSPSGTGIITTSTTVVQEDKQTDGTTDIKDETEGEEKGEAGPSSPSGTGGDTSSTAVVQEDAQTDGTPDIHDTEGEEKGEPEPKSLSGTAGDTTSTTIVQEDAQTDGTTNIKDETEGEEKKEPEPRSPSGTVGNSTTTVVKEDEQTDGTTDKKSETEGEEKGGPEPRSPSGTVDDTTSTTVVQKDAETELTTDMKDENEESGDNGEPTDITAAAETEAKEIAHSEEMKALKTSIDLIEQQIKELSGTSASKITSPGVIFKENAPPTIAHEEDHLESIEEKYHTEDSDAVRFRKAMQNNYLDELVAQHDAMLKAQEEMQKKKELELQEIIADKNVENVKPVKDDSLDETSSIDAKQESDVKMDDADNKSEDVKRGSKRRRTGSYEIPVISSMSSIKTKTNKLVSIDQQTFGQGIGYHKPTDYEQSTVDKDLYQSFLYDREEPKIASAADKIKKTKKTPKEKVKKKKGAKKTEEALQEDEEVAKRRAEAQEAQLQKDLQKTSLEFLAGKTDSDASVATLTRDERIASTMSNASRGESTASSASMGNLTMSADMAQFFGKFGVVGSQHSTTSMKSDDTPSRASITPELKAEVNVYKCCRKQLYTMPVNIKVAKMQYRSLCRGETIKMYQDQIESSRHDVMYEEVNANLKFYKKFAKNIIRIFKVPSSGF